MFPGLSSVSGKDLNVRFDGAELTSDAGVLTLREIEGRFYVDDCLAGCLNDTKAPDRVVH